MELLYSSEVDQRAHLPFAKTRATVGEALQAALEKSRLLELDVKVQYVPIVMAEEHKHRYPARSRLLRKKRVFNCCPQLAITPFLTGTDAERVQEFVSGLREVGPALAKLDVPQEQIAEFDELLDSVLNELASEP